jgi:phosphoglycerate kinase
MKLRTISGLKKLKGVRVLLRVDLNVPLGKNGRIDPDGEVRLRAALPTIEKLLAGGAQVIAVSHLGRPKRRDSKLSLKPVARRLGKLLDQPVLFVEDSLLKGSTVEKKLDKLTDGGLAVLENIRFYPQEKKNDAAFAKRLAKLADVFVSDAFGTSHRSHASTVGVTRYLPSYAGLLLEKEIKNLGRLLNRPKKPFVVMMGGAKITSKLPTLRNMLKVADKVMLGGGMANAFFKAQGWNIGKSVVSSEDIKYAKRLLKEKKLVLPTDVLAATSLTARAKVRFTPADRVKANEYCVDVGADTIRCFAENIKKARTLVWNGPLGLFEVKKFSHGTVALGRMVAARSKGPSFGVVGGGETVQALEMTGMAEWVDHVSTGGGAMLEFLSGKALPGLKPLLKK